MNDVDDQEYERARDEYRRLLEAYSAALARKDAGAAQELLTRAGIAWDALCSFGRTEAEEKQMHAVLVFSAAVQAGDADAAERLYHELPDGERQGADYAEATAPGSLKIWLRR